MVRSKNPYQERISFPSWSVGGSELSAGWTRRGREARFYIWAKRGAFLASCLILSGIWIIILKRRRTFGLGSDKALNGQLDYETLQALGLQNASTSVSKDGNPWRGAGRRRRNDLMVAVSGCGGSFRPAAETGGTVRVRYIMRGPDGTVIDAASRGVDVALGSGQVEQAIEKCLQGMCAGETVRTKLGGDRILIAHVERVGHYYKGMTMTAWESARMDEREKLLDSLSRLVKPIRGRRGASCEMTCAHVSLSCVAVLFHVINNCPRMRAAFKCTECSTAPVGAAGADMPAWVSPSAPRGHAHGACLVAPSASISRCAARYKYTRRLCPCLDSEHLQTLIGDANHIR